MLMLLVSLKIQMMILRKIELLSQIYSPSTLSMLLIQLLKTKQDLENHQWILLATELTFFFIVHSIAFEISHIISLLNSVKVFGPNSLTFLSAYDMTKSTFILLLCFNVLSK